MRLIATLQFRGTAFLFTVCCLVFSIVGCGEEKSTPQESQISQTSSAETQPESTSGAESRTESSSVIETSPASIDRAIASSETSATGQSSATESAQPESGNNTSTSAETPADLKPETSQTNVANSSDSSKPNDDPRANLEAQLEGYQVPPTWLADVSSEWNVNARPWKEGRVEIRRLLGKGDNASRKEGIKLTWDYLQKDDIGDGHEYGMYMFLGNEPLWAIKVYREWLARPTHSYPPYFGFKALASLYTDRGLYEEAESLLLKGLSTAPPKREWLEVRQAEFHDALGDLYAAWGDHDKARASYGNAIQIYPTGKPPYGRHLLPRKAKKVEGKLRVLAMKSIAGATIQDGVFRDATEGYSGEVKVAVTIAQGKISDIKVQHQEKIDQNACVIIPQRIIEKQSFQVDGITGATVTKDALVAATLQALQKAGLK